MKTAELKKIPAADLPDRIWGTDHFNIHNLFRSIEEIHPDSPLIDMLRNSNKIGIFSFIDKDFGQF